MDVAGMKLVSYVIVVTMNIIVVTPSAIIVII